MIKKITEVTVYTNQDSRLVSSWSNVPYFFTETLISKGIKVNRVDLSPPAFLNQLFNKTIPMIIRLIYRHNSFTYFRTSLHFRIVRARIRKAIREFDRSQAHIFLTFSFSPVGLTDVLSVQFCDWTYDYYIRHFENRKPNPLERQGIKREDSQIEGSSLVITLFPSVAQYMRNTYQNKNILYLGNVVNSLYEIPGSDILEDRPKSNDLLFVGGRKYIDGARTLIQAYGVLKNEFPDLKLSIIGMAAEDFGPLPDGITCYGYLDKGKEREKELYYSLFQKAKVFINTTPKWGAFSAAVEAMYYYIPVIVAPFSEFVETFGTDIAFGCYCEENSASLLCSCIRKVLNHHSYSSLRYQAHAAVEDFTWSAYIDKVLKIIQEKLEENQTDIARARE
jgi:glycosyltransferase involved in cell wall biosynthesis